MQRTPSSDDEPLDRLFKLLPAESTAAFLLLRGLFPVESTRDSIIVEMGILYGLTALIVVLTPFLLRRVWNVRDVKIIAFMTMTFIIWALNIDIERVVLASEYLIQDVWSGFEFVLNPLLLKGLLIVWAVTLVPLVIPKKTV
ncbi:MAG: hypothetical protein AAFY73_05800 [Pseudomonadota bacterium]